MRVSVILIALLPCLLSSVYAESKSRYGKQNVPADLQQSTLVCSVDQCVYLMTEDAKLKQKLEAMDSRLNQVTYKLKTAETQLGVLKQENKDLSKELTSLGSRLKSAEQKQGEQQAQIEALKKLPSGRTNVVFSASLRSFGNVGPFKTETTLKYSNVFTNVGKGYDSNTGTFTVPVSGVYLFMFYNHALGAKATYLTLTRNGQRVVTTGHHRNTFESSHNGANAITLQLMKGDKMCIRLWAENWVFDDDKNYTTFTGILLFTV
ncbi:caprin-2 [Astyanax mexicanus]|uniref:caprin-2 n=1 Tax=Astyanax mexicanus TaxID=7994 RepID=UPI0020CB5746|nr:caprin-2 [Astyanax mexicanus]